MSPLVDQTNAMEIFNRLKHLPIPIPIPAAPSPAHVRTTTIPKVETSTCESFVLADTGLTTEEKTEFRRIVKGLGGSVVQKITENVTHLVTRRTNNTFKSPRTLKYLDALLQGAWIVSYEWIEESSRAGKWLHEGDFEIQGDTSVGISDGPSRARISLKRDNEKPLFSGLWLGFLGKFATGISRNDLFHLAKKGGASSVCKTLPFSPASSSSSSSLISVFGTSEETSSHAEKGRMIVVLDKDLVPKDAVDAIRRFHVSLKHLDPSRRDPSSFVITTTDWLLDSLSRYSLQDLSSYQPTTTATTTTST